MPMTYTKLKTISINQRNITQSTILTERCTLHTAMHNTHSTLITDNCQLNPSANCKI